MKDLFQNIMTFYLTYRHAAIVFRVLAAASTWRNSRVHHSKPGSWKIKATTAFEQTFGTDRIKNLQRTSYQNHMLL